MLTLPKLTIPRSEAEVLINVQIDKGNRLFNYTPTNEGLELAQEEFLKWDECNKNLLVELFDSPAVSEEYAAPCRGMVLTPGSLLEKLHYYEEPLTDKIRLLEIIRERLPQYKEPIQAKAKSIDDDIRSVERICSRFHAVARKLRERHDDRETLNVADEYDVQDLLHALLCIYFDDIRPEEWTPSYAGGASRVDFLIKQEQIVIEVKKTRPTLKAKLLGEQLLIDIARYKHHPSCKYLYCFVYDPDGWISNPHGIENDLSQQHNDLIVKVFIHPKSH